MASKFIFSVTEFVTEKVNIPCLGPDVPMAKALRTRLAFRRAEREYAVYIL